MKVNQESCGNSHVGRLFSKKYDDQFFEEGLFEHEVWKKEKETPKEIIGKML